MLFLLGVVVLLIGIEEFKPKKRAYLINKSFEQFKNEENNEQ